MAVSNNHTSVTQVIHFHDPRPPHEIQFRLERDLMELFEPLPDAPQWTLRATMKSGSHSYVFHLRFEAALMMTNSYSLSVELSCPERPAPQQTDLHQSLTGWMDFWTRDFTRAEPPTVGEGLPEKYQRLCAAASTAEVHLTDVAALQQEILRQMRHGATYSTAHKEGGTNIAFRRGRFVRSDYGDWSQVQHFTDEKAFLAFLRQFYDVETSRNIMPQRVSDYQAWKLILRLLNPRGSAASAPSPSALAGRGSQSWGALVLAMTVAGAFLMVLVRGHLALQGRAPTPVIAALFYPSLAVLGVAVVFAALWLYQNWESS